MLSECILLFSNGFHNSQRVFIIHPNDENLFERKQRYDIILSIEYILSFSNGFYNSQCIFIIHLNDIIESFRLKESKEGEVSSECILSFSNGFHNSCRNYSHSILHNPSRRRESFRLKQNRGTSYIYIRCADITL